MAKRVRVWQKRRGVLRRVAAPPNSKLIGDKRIDMIKLRAAGLSWRQIGDQLGVSYESCRRLYLRLIEIGKL